MFIVFLCCFKMITGSHSALGEIKNVFVFMVVAMFCCVNRGRDGLSSKVLSSS